MKLLAFETATEACSVALYFDGQIIERHEVAPRLHAEYALPWAEALMAQAGISRAQLDVIAISRGPGAFTGVRLAIALAQGIALALDRPVIAVSTLQVLAVQAGDQRVLAAIDARMGEVYSAAFEPSPGGPRLVGGESVGAPGEVRLPQGEDRWHGVGTGFAAAGGVLQHRLQPRLLRIDAHALPRAADVARLAIAAHARGEAIAPDQVEPAYLRNNVALTLAEQQAQRALR